MSGIAALIDFTGAPAQRNVIEAMTMAMDYRAPDGRWHWVEGPAALGHCAMHTMAPGEESRQPLASPASGAVLVMDGFLSNWEELTTELEQAGVRLRARTDAELVLHAYEQWGEGLARHLDGEFSIVIWDPRQRRALCLSDPIGMRPMHYAWDRQRLIVASDMKPVLHALGRDPTPNLGFLAENCSGDWYSLSDTIWQEVSRLEPAHVLQVEAGRNPSKREYWTIERVELNRYASDEEYFEEYRHVLSECVRRTARTNRPLACDVSGGLDSSAVFTVAHGLMKGGQIHVPAVRGYTMRGMKGTEADEVVFARAVGRNVGQAITEVPMHFPRLDWFREELAHDANLPAFPNCAMLIGQNRAMAADGCRVALNGQGGDHWLGGSGRYYVDELQNWQWRWLARSFGADRRDRGVMEASGNLGRQGAAAMLPAAAKSLIKRALGTHGEPLEGPASFLNDAMQQEFVRRRDALLAALPEDPKLHRIHRVLRYPFDRLIVTQHNPQMIRLGLEPRHPMFSRRFVEYSVATPEYLRYRGTTNRYIHRAALRGVLPPEVTNRTSEAVFNLAMNRHLPDLVRRLGQEDFPVYSELIDAARVEKRLEECCSAPIEGVYRWQIWGLYLALGVLLPSR